MSKKTSKENRVFAVAGVEFTKVSDAKIYASNLNKEFAAAFVAANCSPFAFCKWIAAETSQSSIWFRSSVLGLTSDKLSNPEAVFSALRSVYPIKNDKGQICRKVASGAKGVFSCVPVSVFGVDILNACTAAYLRGVRPVTLPDFGKVNENGEVFAISSEEYESAKESAKESRKNDKASKDAKINKAAELENALRALVAATATSKAANIVAARAAALSLLS